jgi:hypothetical protein
MFSTSLVDAWLAATADVQPTVALTVGRITCRSSRAHVHGTLVLGGIPLPGVLPRGQAVRSGGAWRVTVSTLCRWAGVQDPRLASLAPCAR